MAPTSAEDRRRGINFLLVAVGSFVLGVWGFFDPTLLGMSRQSADDPRWILPAVMLPMAAIEIGIAVYFFLRARRAAA